MNYFDIPNQVTVEGRTFTYRWESSWEGYHEYRLIYTPDGKTEEKEVWLLLDRGGEVDRIVTDHLYISGRMNYECRTPNFDKFRFGGSFEDFKDLFGIDKEDIKRSSRTRKPLNNGWQFWRLNHVVFIP
jgi:hypothetical protein